MGIVVSMRDKVVTFTEEQTKAIGLLIQGKTRVEVAEACSVHRVTVQKWLLKPEFRKAIERERGDAFKRSKAQIQHLFNIGTQSAERVLRDIENKHYSRVYELICKMVGVLDDKPQINIIILNSVDNYTQIHELRKLIMERISLLSDDEKQKLIESENIDDRSIDAEYEDISD